MTAREVCVISSKKMIPDMCVSSKGNLGLVMLP